MTNERLGFTSLETAEITGRLNVLLANYHVHYQKLRAFHWSVEGADFYELHELFEKLYNETKVNIDVVAERIRVFGHHPMNTLKQYLNTSEIKEVKKIPTSYEMGQEILRDFEILFAHLYSAISAANEIGDASTSNYCTKFLSNLETHHWQLNAFLKPEAKI